MINIFMQRIGIFYLHRDWAENLFNDLLSQIPQEAIGKIIKSRHELVAYLRDGSFIRCVKANDCSRGCKFDKIFIEKGIDKKIYDCIIMPTYINRYSGPQVFDKSGFPYSAKFYYLEELAKSSKEE